MPLLCKEPQTKKIHQTKFNKLCHKKKGWLFEIIFNDFKYSTTNYK